MASVVLAVSPLALAPPASGGGVWLGIGFGIGFG